MKQMKRIFVCSRLRGKNQQEMDKHIEQAQQFAKFVIREDYGAPFVPHLLYPQFLDDSSAFERDMGIESGLSYLSVCDVVFAFIDDSNVVSDGMKQEIQYAIDHGIPVLPFTVVNGKISRKKSLLNQWQNTWLNVLQS